MNRPDELDRDLLHLVAQVDPVPPGVVQAAAASLTWLRVEDELMELLEDSALTGSGVRSGFSRLLTFMTGATSVVLEVGEHGDHRSVTGRVSGQAVSAVEIRHAGGTTSTEVGERGRFHVDGLPAGPMSLRLAPSGAEHAALTTSWVSI